MNYQQTIKELVRYVRERLQVSEQSSHFTFNISATGNTHSGELKVEIQLDETYKFNVRVSGGELESVIDEHLRRLGWTEQNAPLCLPNVKTIETKPEINDEIPF